MTARLYVFAIISGLTGLVLLCLTLQLPGGAQVSTLIGPRTWPLGILVAMLSLIVLMLTLLALRGPAQFANADETDYAVVSDAPHPMQAKVVDKAVTRDHPGGYIWRHVSIFAATIAYTIGMVFTGYLLATAVFAAVVTLILGERRPLRILLTTTIAVLLVAVVFDRALNIPLP